MNNADILMTIRLRARLAITSSAGGISLIYNTTTPNVIFNELSVTSDILSVAASGTGLINIGVNIFNVSDTRCPSGGQRLGTAGNYTTCYPFDFTPSNLGVSFTTDNFLNFVESGSGLAYIVSFVGQITFNDTAFSVFKNPSGTFQIFYRNPLLDLRISAGNNMVVTPGVGLGNFTVATTTAPIFTGTTTTNGVLLPSGASIKFNDTSNNATITMSAPPGLTQSYNLILPPTPGLDGQVAQAVGDGSIIWIGIRRRIFESCANGTANLGVSSTAFNTLLAGTACATGPASKFIAANTIRVGTVFDMIIGGILSRAGSATIQTRILVNSTTVVTSVAADTGAARTNVGFQATARCLFQTIGVSGSVLCTGIFLHDQMLSGQVLSTLVPITVDTTQVLFFNMELAFSSSASNMFTSSMTAMYIAL